MKAKQVRVDASTATVRNYTKAMLALQCSFGIRTTLSLLSCNYIKNDMVWRYIKQRTTLA
jgi:hypothetical protein